MRLSKPIVAFSLSTLAFATNGNSVLPDCGEYDITTGEPPTSIGELEVTDDGKKCTETRGDAQAEWDYDAGSQVYERNPGNNNTPTLCFAGDADSGYTWQLVNNDGEIVAKGDLVQ